MMDTSETMRRTVRTTPATLLRYGAGDPLTTATATRATVGTYTGTVSDTLLRYAAGGSMSSATRTRASLATFAGNA